MQLGVIVVGDVYEAQRHSFEHWYACRYGGEIERDWEMCQNIVQLIGRRIRKVKDEP